jgi:hypothetical protein
MNNIYIIDTSSFIKIEPESYPTDIFVSMWNYLEDLIEKGRIISHIKVLEQLKEYEGKKRGIIVWAEKHKDIFKQITPSQVNIVREIINTDNFKALINTDKPNGDTDVFIIALALEKPTQETLYSFNSKKIVVSEEKEHGDKIKIPFVCKHYKIECIDIFEMFRREGWKW